MSYPTDEILINDFNSEKLSITKMAEKYNLPINDIKKDIKRLQREERIGFKGTNGKVITKPGESFPEKLKRSKNAKPGPKPKKKKYSLKDTEEFSDNESSKLGDMLKDLSTSEDMEKENVSTYHKELLIEVIHKLIC